MLELAMKEENILLFNVDFMTKEQSYMKRIVN